MGIQKTAAQKKMQSRAKTAKAEEVHRKRTIEKRSPSTLLRKHNSKNHQMVMKQILNQKMSFVMKRCSPKNSASQLACKLL